MAQTGPVHKVLLILSLHIKTLHGNVNIIYFYANIKNSSVQEKKISAILTKAAKKYENRIPKYVPEILEILRS